MKPVDINLSKQNIEMKSLMIYILLAFLTSFSSTKSISERSVNDDNLILVHTIFRHGNRTVSNNVYTGNPYGDEKFYMPYKYGQLTNVGKQTEYNVGLALRERYDAFLGTEYNIDVIDARSTNVNRTKMSVLLVTAGLFPPTGNLVWRSDINWQPIPYNTFDNDKVLSGRKVCTNYKKLYKKVLKSDDIVKYLKKYEKVFDYLSNHTTDDISKPKHVADLYVDLLVQKAYGYPLEEWTSKYMKEMKQLTIDNYYYMAYTKKLKKIVAGYLIKKIINDTEYHIQHLPEVKMYLYSAHEKNIATLLITLGIFDNEVPMFGSYMLVEVRLINGVYGFQFYYQNYAGTEHKLLRIPGCADFCPIYDFKKVVDENIPGDYDCVIN